MDKFLYLRLVIQFLGNDENVFALKLLIVFSTINMTICTINNTNHCIYRYIYCINFYYIMYTVEWIQHHEKNK